MTKRPRLAWRLLDAMPLAIHVADWAENRITFSNREAQTLWGLAEHRPQALALTALENRIHAEDRNRYSETLAHLCSCDDLFAAHTTPPGSAKGGGCDAPPLAVRDLMALGGQSQQTVEFRVKNCNEEWRWAQCWIIPLHRMRSNASLQVLFCAQDVTQRKADEANLKYRSCHDALTGLHNRDYFEAELARLANSRAYPVSLMIIDIDNLKPVNDRLGHQAGDEMLRRLAEVLKKAFRGEDVVARIGGDEFAVVLPDTNNEALTNAVFRVRRCLTQHNAAHSRLPLQISIGAASALGPDDHLPDIFQQADRAMYLDKQQRKALTGLSRT